MTGLLTRTDREQLLRNGLESAGGAEIDPAPVLKLFTPDARAVWLLTELHPNDEDVAFGLCDLGFGCPEIGSVCISEIEAVRGPLGFSVQRDDLFTADRPLSEYATLARRAGRIVA